MKAVNVDDVLKIIHKYGKYIFVTDEKKYSSMIDEIANLKALEQEPKSVIYSGDGYADGYMVYDMAECPSCGWQFEDGDKDWEEPFCCHCGQKLEWFKESEDNNGNIRLYECCM